MICTVYSLPAHNYSTKGTQVDVGERTGDEARAVAIEVVRDLLTAPERARFQVLATYLPEC